MSQGSTMSMPYNSYAQPPISLETKHQASAQSYASPGNLFSPSGYQQIAEPPDLERIRQKDYRLKRQIRIWKLVTRVFTFLLAIYPLYSQATTLHKFLSTRDIIIGGRNAWAKETTIWPTILLLSTSSATVLVSLLILASYLLSVKHANTTEKTVGTAGFVIEMGAHIAVWVATAVAYRLGQTGNDLWGWTCSDKADQIQDQFQAVIDFNNFCNVQSYAWILSIAQAVALIVTGAVYYLAWRRMKHKERMEKDSIQNPTHF